MLEELENTCKKKILELSVVWLINEFIEEERKKKESKRTNRL